MGQLLPPETKNSHLTKVSLFTNLAGRPPTPRAWGTDGAAMSSAALGRLGAASQAAQL